MSLSHFRQKIGDKEMNCKITSPYICVKDMEKVFKSTFLDVFIIGALATLYTHPKGIHLFRGAERLSGMLSYLSFLKIYSIISAAVGCFGSWILSVPALILTIAFTQDLSANKR